MKPRYKKGDKVRVIKSLVYNADKEWVGKILTIKSNFLYKKNWYEVEENSYGYSEEQLKKYSPSRTGKYRNEKGQFCKEYTNGHGRLAMPDSKQRNYQKKNNNIFVGMDFGKGKDQTVLTYRVEVLPKEITINGTVYVEKKIDELGRKV